MLKQIIIGLIRVYQFFSRRFLRNICRFYPSCSQYMIETIEKYGLLQGIGRGLGRVCRCRPGQPGGIDLP